MVALAGVLRDITTLAGALLFVNDRVDVALAAGADGAHLGPDDIPPGAARGAVPSGFLLGASTDRPEVARRLAADGVDYIGCGTVYPTSTKADAGSAIGTEGLQRVVESVAIPVVGIGGIDATRAAEILTRTSAAGVAVVGAVMASPDPGHVVRGILQAFHDPG
jgi:thiamine-phosphate diphosphorylase